MIEGRQIFKLLYALEHATLRLKAKKHLYEKLTNTRLGDHNHCQKKRRGERKKKRQ